MTLVVEFQGKPQTRMSEMCLKSGVEGQCVEWACRCSDWVANSINRLF